MILEILADAREIVDNGHVLFLEMCCRADAGEHQELGRADGARRHDHLACRVEALELPAGDDFNANGAALLNEKTGDEEIGSHREIGTLQHGFQIAHSGAAAAPFLVVV